jgi:hypothetical protein
VIARERTGFSRAPGRGARAADAARGEVLGILDIPLPIGEFAAP